MKIYKFYADKNYADTSRDPDDIHILFEEYYHDFETAKKRVEKYIYENFLTDKFYNERNPDNPIKRVVKLDKNGEYKATHMCSYGETIYLKEINLRG